MNDHYLITCVPFILLCWAFLYLLRTCIRLPIFHFFHAIMDDSFNIMKTSKTILHYLLQAFVENYHLECENTITTSRTVFVS